MSRDTSMTKTQLSIDRSLEGCLQQLKDMVVIDAASISTTLPLSGGRKGLEEDLYAPPRHTTWCDIYMLQQQITYRGKVSLPYWYTKMPDESNRIEVVLLRSQYPSKGVHFPYHDTPQKRKNIYAISVLSCSQWNINATTVFINRFTLLSHRTANKINSDYKRPTLWGGNCHG